MASNPRIRFIRDASSPSVAGLSARSAAAIYLGLRRRRPYFIDASVISNRTLRRTKTIPMIHSMANPRSIIGARSRMSDRSA